MAQKPGSKESTSLPTSAPSAELGRVPDLGDRVKIWWPDDGAFYSGKVTRFNDQDNTHFIEYDDGETEFLDMKNERWLKIGIESDSNLDEEKVESKPDHISAAVQTSDAVQKASSILGPSASAASAAATATTGATANSIGQVGSTTSVMSGVTVNPNISPDAPAKLIPVPPKKAVGSAPEKKVAESAKKTEMKASDNPTNSGNQTKPPSHQVSNGPPTVAALEIVPPDVPRYKLQPRHANGKFGALPPELKVAAQRSKTGDPGATTTGGTNSSSGKTRSVNSGRPGAQSATTVAVGNRAVVSGPHVTRRPGSYDPSKLPAAQAAGSTGNTAVKRNAPLPAGRPLVAPSKSAASLGHAADVPKKKMRMSAPSSAQVARAVTTVRMPQTGAVAGMASVNTGYASNPPKGRPVAHRAVNVARPNQRLTKSTPMAGVTLPSGNNEAAKPIEEMILDNKNELVKVQRSVTLLHSMQRDMTKQLRVDESESIRRQSVLQNEMERLRMDVRRLLDGQNDLMIAMGNLQQRMDGVPRDSFQPSSSRQPYQPPQYRGQWRGGGYARGEFYDPPGRYPGDAGWDRGRDRPVVSQPGRRISSDRVPQSESIVAQVKGDILALVAKQVMIWLLETDHECRSGDLATWAQVETTKCMERVAYLLGKFTEYAHALRVLTDSLGLDSGQLLWFTDGASAENLRMARQNYEVWDPPPTDLEWVNEVKLLVEVEKRFKVALGNYEISVNETTLAACISVANAAAAAVPIVRASNGPKSAVKPPNGGQPVQETAADIVAAAGSVPQPPPPVQQLSAQTAQQTNDETGEAATMMVGGSSVHMEPGFTTTSNPNGGAM